MSNLPRSPRSFILPVHPSEKNALPIHHTPHLTWPQPSRNVSFQGPCAPFRGRSILRDDSPRKTQSREAAVH